MIAGSAHSLLLLLGSEREDRGHRHVGLDSDPHPQPAAVRVDHLLGEDQRGVVVAALAAVLLGLVESEEPELAHPLEHPIGKRRLLPLLGVGLELLDHKAADRFAQLLVLVGEDEVLALGGEVGLEDVGGGHSRFLRKVDSRTSYLLLGTLPSAHVLRHPPLRRIRRRRRDDCARPARHPQRALRRAAGRACRGAAGRARRRCGALRGPDLDPRSGVLRGCEPGWVRGRRAAGAQAFRDRALPAGVPAARRARQALDLRCQRPRAGRRAWDRARLRSDHRARRSALRDPRDQRRRVPVHDHGADLPQRRAQEDQRAAAARRADLGRGGAADRDRQQRGARRGVRLCGRRLGRRSSRPRAR